MDEAAAPGTLRGRRRRNLNRGPEEEPHGSRRRPLGRRGMGGDQHQCVEQTPPVGLGRLPAQGLGERGQRGHEPDRELVGPDVKRPGHHGDGPPEPGCAPQPDQRRRYPRPRRRPGRAALLTGLQRDHQPQAQGLGEPGQGRGRRVAPAVLEVGDVGDGEARPASSRWAPRSWPASRCRQRSMSTNTSQPVTDKAERSREITASPATGRIGGRAHTRRRASGIIGL